MLAMELATCRSGRSDGASGSPTRGKGRLRQEARAARLRGGNGAPFGDQEAVGGDAHAGVVVEAAPTSPFEVAEPDLVVSDRQRHRGLAVRLPWSPQRGAESHPLVGTVQRPARVASVTLVRWPAIGRGRFAVLRCCAPMATLKHAKTRTATTRRSCSC
jgi:hypothetical protein